MDTIILQTDSAGKLKVPAGFFLTDQNAAALQTFLDKIPLVVALDEHGRPVDLTGDIEPEYCDHAGATWSSCFDTRCARCGARLFLPPRFLAKRPEAELETMYAAWEAAGWPEFIGGKEAHWNMRPEYWTLTAHPLFAHVGGLPVRAGQVTA